MRPSKLRLGPELEIPASAVTERFGILAVSGAGKSNLAAVMAEEMYLCAQPFVVIDPEGSWWGLRLSDDGKDAGLQIPIFGGRHADVPLEPTAGKMMAELIAERRLTCILDMEEFSKGELTRFLTDFAETLYRKNRDPLHVFAEEADEYIPQKPMKSQARCLGAFQRLVRRGRKRGIGVTLITQRSAVLNKDVLTQIQTLFVLRTTGPQDRKAVESWIEYHAQKKELLASLPTLETGVAWCWSPFWLKTVAQYAISRRVTYDSAATPSGNKAAPQVSLGDIDLEGIRKAMADTIERAEAEDPKRLKARIAKLERELRARPEPEVTTVEVPMPVLDPDDVKALVKAIDKLDAIRDQMAQSQQVVVCEASVLRTQLERAGYAWAMRPSKEPPLSFSVGEEARRIVSGIIDKEALSLEKMATNGLSRYAWSLLEAMAERHPMPCTTSQLSILSGRSKRSSAFGPAVRELIDGGLVTKTDGGLVLTGAGAAQFQSMPEPRTTQERIDRWAKGMGKCEEALFRAIAENYPEPMSSNALALLTDYSPTSSGFTGALSSLRRAGLVEQGDNGWVAHESLF